MRLIASGDPEHDRVSAYGLTLHQERKKPIVRLARWYTARGEYLGKGDLDDQDYWNIRKELLATDAFIVLHPARLGNRTNEKEPGIRFLSEQAHSIVTKNEFFAIDPILVQGESMFRRQSVNFMPLTVSQAFELLQVFAP